MILNNESNSLGEQMKYRRNTILIIAACVIGGLVISFAAYTAFNIIQILAPSNDRNNQDPSAQASMLECTQEWARLAPVPDSKEQFTISTEGGPFTRAFRASFVLPEDDLKDWVEASPGLRDAGVEMEGIKNFAIEPGGGAMYAEAVIDFDSGLVKVYTYWS